MRIVIDDAGDLTPAWRDQFGIVTVPVNIHFGTEEFLSVVEMTRPAFYEKVKTVNDANFPKTSQPNPYQFAEVFRRLFAEGEDSILTITVGQKLSKTYDSAVQAAQEVADLGQVTVFDSESGSAAQGYLAVTAARMAAQGAGMDEILARLEEMRSEQVICLLINSLEFAVKGGRVSGLQSMIASLLSIKPIMKVEDGLIVEAGKVRTQKKALQFMIGFAKEQVGEQPVKLAFLHANAPDEADALRALATPHFTATEVVSMDLCVPVAINLGPGAVGIVAIPDRP